MANRQWLFKQANHGAYIRILVYRWRLRTRILALARRWTLTRALVMSVSQATQLHDFSRIQHSSCVLLSWDIWTPKKNSCTAHYYNYTTCIFMALYYSSVAEAVDTTVAQYLSCHCTKRVPWTNAFCWEDLISSLEEGNISSVCTAVVNSSEDQCCKFAQHC